MKRICKHTSVFNMSGENAPIEKIVSGETLIFQTEDCFGGQVTNEKDGINTLDWDRINPATGPVFVEGAEIGDVLKVTIHSIDLAPYGIMAAVPENGIFGDQVKESSVKIMPVKDGFTYFNDIKIPLRKMIGVIGVAPEKGAVSCGTPGSHGGNMDNTAITEGSSIYFPVFKKGALLAMGDVHAAMGDGEVMVSGVEIPAEIKVTVEVIKGIELHDPVLENETSIYGIVSDTNLFEAIHKASGMMLKLVMERLGLSLNDAGMLLSACGNAEICQIVDPLMTARFSIPKYILGKDSGFISHK